MKTADVHWKDAAVGRFQNGDTIRTDAFRLTEYTDDKGTLAARMLFDQKSDADENVNVIKTCQNEVLGLSEKRHRLKGVDGK